MDNMVLYCVTPADKDDVISKGKALITGANTLFQHITAQARFMSSYLF